VGTNELAVLVEPTGDGTIGAGNRHGGTGNDVRQPENVQFTALPHDTEAETLRKTLPHAAADDGCGTPRLPRLADDRAAHAYAASDNGAVGGDATNAAGDVRPVVWTCALSQAYVP
jgi:hypothetical protein